MLVLFDNNIPRGLARILKAHTVIEARARNWHLLKNGELLQAAEDAAFDVMVTSDKSIKYQQNLTGRKIAFVVLGNQQWPVLRGYVERVVVAVNAAPPGSYVEVPVPRYDTI